MLLVPNSHSLLPLQLMKFQPGSTEKAFYHLPQERSSQWDNNEAMRIRTPHDGKD
jgi:hypothetical protein